MTTLKRYELKFGHENAPVFLKEQTAFKLSTSVKDLARVFILNNPYLRIYSIKEVGNVSYKKEKVEK